MFGVSPAETFLELVEEEEGKLAWSLPSAWDSCLLLDPSRGAPGAQRVFFTLKELTGT